MQPPGIEPLARHALAFVLAGGRGSRLMELTDRRAKPAVYFGGKSRIIDFALSNAMNSGIRRIAVATQYKAHSLIRHLQMGWNFFRPERNESFDILPASQRISEKNWYLGTADAVYQNIDIVEPHDARFIVLLAGDHIYKMDYELMLRQHVEQGADVTIGCLEVPRSEASGFGVMHIDDRDVIVSFLEKPADPPPMPGQPDKSLASMGIYVFESKFLFEELRRDAEDPNSSHDFGKDIIPHIVKHGRAVAHQFSRSCVRSTMIHAAIGATSERWMPIGPPISTSPISCPSSISTTGPGRSGPMPKSHRPPSSSTTRMSGAARRSPRWFPEDASFPAPRSGDPCCSPVCMFIPTAKSKMP